MARVKIINVILLTAILSGCASQFGPFVDRRREAGGLANGALYVGVSTPENPAICYNKIYTSFTKVQNLATEECLNNKTGNYAEPVNETLFTCRFFVPNHYYFKCENKEDKNKENVK